MTIYLLQESIMVLLTKGYLQTHIGIHRAFVVILLIISTAFICALLDELIEKYAKILKGKF